MALTTTQPSSPLLHLLITSMTTCFSPLPKFSVISESGLARRQQVLQEHSRLLPGSLTQAHEAVEHRLRPKHGERRLRTGKPREYPPANGRPASLPAPATSLPFTQTLRTSALSFVIYSSSWRKAYPLLTLPHALLHLHTSPGAATWHSNCAKLGPAHS